MKEKRDMSRTDLARMVTNLRKELKEQIKENQELEKKVDGLVTVIDLVKEHLKKASKISVDDYTGIIDFIKELKEILERVNEEWVPFVINANIYGKD